MIERHKILRVTMTQDYLVKMIDNERTEINGWSIKEVIKDWFHDTNIDSYHATRNAHQLGFGKQILEIEEVDVE